MKSYDVLLAEAFAERRSAHRARSVSRSPSTPLAVVAIALTWAAFGCALFAGPDAPVLVLSLGLSAVVHALLAFAFHLTDRSQP